MKELSTLYNNGIRQILKVQMITPLTLLYIISKRAPFEILAKKICWRYAAYLKEIKNHDPEKKGEERVIHDIVKAQLNMDWKDELRQELALALHNRYEGIAAIYKEWKRSM